MADGEWHDLVLMRAGSYVSLELDGGEGALSATRWVKSGDFHEIAIDCTKIILGAELNFDGDIITGDFDNGSRAG